jgi:hypothetical protein
MHPPSAHWSRVGLAFLIGTICEKGIFLLTRRVI